MEIATDEGVVDVHVTYVDEAGVSQPEWEGFIDRFDVASKISSWMQHNRSSSREFSDIFRREVFAWTDSPLDQMSVLSRAVEYDDILGNLADVTEDMTYERMRFEDPDEDFEDIWNQLAEEWDLVGLHRQMFRELFKCSQVTVGVLWGRSQLKVRNNAHLEHRRQFEEHKAKREGVEVERKPGNRNRRRSFDLYVPKRFTVLAPNKVVPVGNQMFGLERYAYIADPEEHHAFGQLYQPGQDDPFHGFLDHPDDPIFHQMVEGPYAPQGRELQELQDIDVPVDRLWLMRKASVFNHSLTKSNYERFAARRLLPALEILDLKRHLRASDRAVLVGQTNYLVVLRKGSDTMPAKRQEIENLQAQAKTVARVPVLVGDHRLQVDIITPENDNTLREGRHHTLDSRLVALALGSFAPSRIAAGQGGGTEVDDLSKVVSRRLESRRERLASDFRRDVCRRIVDLNESLTSAPNINFAPRKVTLDVNTDIINAVLKLRDRGEVSRETMLEEFGFDVQTEYVRRVFEITEGHDDVFQSSVPFSSPSAQPGQGQGVPAGAHGQEGGHPPGEPNEKKREEPGKGERSTKS